MERLSGLDASFLYMESPAHPMHTLKLLVLEPTTAELEGSLHDRLHANLAARLDLLPPLRRRLLGVPLGLHHPLWIEDPSFDLSAHLRRAQVPAPGSRAQLDGIVAEIAAEPLDRRRPLWEIWSLEGLEHDRVAILVKIHHAVADGMAVAALLANVMTPEREPSDRTPWAPDRVPSPAELLADAAVDHARLLARLPGLAVRTARRGLALAWSRRGASVRTPWPILDTPPTSFNGALTGARAFATASLPLSDAKTIKAHFGVTLNDVVLAIVAGALRRYLDARGELPTRSLVASVPTASGAHDGAPRLTGNRVSSLFTSLATHVADPVERLRAIHAVTVEAKELQHALGTELLGDWAAYSAPGAVSWALRQWNDRRLADVFPAPINLIVSNVPGPHAPLSVPGHRLLAIYSVGPVLEGIGLNITAWSYQGELHVGILACRDMVPEPHLIADGLTVALGELLARAEEAPVTAGPPT